MVDVVLEVVVVVGESEVVTVVGSGCRWQETEYNPTFCVSVGTLEVTGPSVPGQEPPHAPHTPAPRQYAVKTGEESDCAGSIQKTVCARSPSCPTPHIGIMPDEKKP